MAARKAKKTSRKRKRKATKPRRKSTKSTLPKGWPDWADEFLHELSLTGHVGNAAAKVGYERSTPYKLSREVDTFGRAMAASRKAGKQSKYEELAEVSIDRCINGYDEPVFHEGVVVGYKTRFPQATEIFHLRMGLPKEFNLAHGDTSGGVGGKTPEQVATQIRAYLAAMDGSVPK